MNISFHPYSSKENKYAALMIRMLESLEGVHVTPFELKSALTGAKDVFGAQIIWLNWYDNYYGIVNTVFKVLVLILLKITGKKIVTVVHNKKPHDVDCSVANYLRKIVLVFSSNIIIHSKITIQHIDKKYHKKLVYVPHPNYINEYGASLLKDQQSDTQLKLLFFGAVKPYKNIELLIKVCNELQEIELRIIGKPSSKEYAHSLRQLVESSSISLDLEFIKDEDIPGILSGCDVLVLPYSIESSLNSGTVLLAFSYGKTVICPEIGTLMDMQTQCFLSYTYENEKDHYMELKKVLEKAIEMHAQNPNQFKEWGERMYNEVEELNALPSIKAIIDSEIVAKA